MLNRLCLQEIIKKAESGITVPYLCRLSDDETYFVKGRSLTAKGLIAEVVCANLGTAFGLPIPPMALCAIDEEMLAYDPAARSSLGVGCAFASRSQAGLVELSAATLNLCSTPLLQRLFVFDYWIMNEDRVDGGNPNLFWSVEQNALVVLDHNLAFDPEFSFERNQKLHLCSRSWFTPTVDMVLLQELRTEMAKALGDIQHVLDEIPAEWIDAAPGHLEHAMNILGRYADNSFWRPLL